LSKDIAIKPGVSNRGGDDTGCFEIKVRSHTYGHENSTIDIMRGFGRRN